MQLQTPTSDPRHKLKPCPQCGREDWFYGTKKRCRHCREAAASSPEGQQKSKAQRIAVRAVNRGELVRQPCVVCTERGLANADKAHGHHEDYSKPLDVIWLCPLHHNWIHKYGHAELFKYRNNPTA